MHVYRGANLTSLLFMNVYRIYIFLVCFSSPLCWWIDKKREKILVSLYMHVYFISSFMQKAEKNLVSLCIYVVIWFMLFIEYLYVYCYAWVKGELLWSLTLIHAYITPWVLSLSKRGRLLAQRPSTLVLMMINSCSYVYWLSCDV